MEKRKRPPLKSCYYRINKFKQHDFNSGWNPIPIPPPCWKRMGLSKDLAIGQVFLMTLIINGIKKERPDGITPKVRSLVIVKCKEENGLRSQNFS
ncbi:hypothetical protein BVG16_17925 [Paenibacillus selenitireducens]|uniref:Uncharacterized protein n=1 Tax=Paenibacillus selenitireducens TaxID=1324314 RepID=A0A1T2X8T0_9BACL|nr:hypothetical protein BVG16_17925 [Paenibacillus selenitireducens]